VPIAEGKIAATRHDKNNSVLSFAKKHLSSVKRRSGEDYATHGEEVAATLLEINSDSSLFRVALLHDLLVHSDGLYLLEQSPLSRDEKETVRRMHSLRRLHIDENTSDLDKTIDNFATDGRLVALRMAHRLNDIRHLDRFPRTLQRDITRETLHMYTAIAGRLGMYEIRYEMEDACFSFLHPVVSSRLQKKFEQNRRIDLACLTHAASYLKKEIEKQQIDCSVDYRIKGLYSTYRKMVIKKRTFEELTDRLALRIVVHNTDECYRVLGIIHNVMHPIPGKLKDYIGAPKENGYQSIHTVVYPLPGVTELPIEIQIRTEDMHRVCEYGSLSHGDYKSYLYTLQAQPARVNLFRNLQHLHEEARSPQQFEKALRQYFREDHMAIFDEENNLFHIRKPATALDFLVHAHDKRCRKLKEAKINGRRQSFETHLRDGDTVEAIFGRTVRLNKEWADACKHSQHRKLIRAWA